MFSVAFLATWTGRRTLGPTGNFFVAMGSEQGGCDGTEAGPASSEQCLSFVALQEAQRLPGWQLLVVTVDQEIKASIRQVLSHHTSTPCQPGKAPGVASSLKDCGLEANVGTAQMAQLRLQIPHMLNQASGQRGCM